MVHRPLIRRPVIHLTMVHRAMVHALMRVGGLGFFLRLRILVTGMRACSLMVAMPLMRLRQRRGGERDQRSRDKQLQLHAARSGPATVTVCIIPPCM
ncbi:hypothetical protein GCM10009424_10850 [Sphingomonas ursincola]